jgi:hypothetical protein
MSVKDLPSSYEVTQETEGSPKSTLLQMLAENKPYVFLRASVSGEDGTTFLVEMDTNISLEDSEILHAILDSTQKALQDAENGDDVKV